MHANVKIRHSWSLILTFLSRQHFLSPKFLVFNGFCICLIISVLCSIRAGVSSKTVSETA